MNQKQDQSTLQFDSKNFTLGTASLAWIIVVITAILGNLPFYHLGYIAGDVGEGVYHAREIITGRIPYRDFFTHHFQGYTFPFWLLELTTGTTPVCIWWLNVALQIINALLIFAILAGSRSSRLAAAFIWVTVGWAWGWQVMIFNVQSSLLPLILLTTLFATKALAQKSFWYLNLACLSWGFLFCCDQRAVFYAPLLLLPFLHLADRRWLRSLLTPLACSILIPALALIYLFFNSALADWYNQTIRFPLFFRNAEVVTSFWPQYFSLLTHGFSAELFWVVLGFTGSLLAAIGTTRRIVGLNALLLWLGGLGYVAVGGRGYLHYMLVFVPPMVLGTALLVESALSHRLVGKTLAFGLVLLALLQGLRPLQLYFQTGSWFVPGDELVLQSAGEYIRDNTSPIDRILVWGYAPQIYLYANRLGGFTDVGLITIAGSDPKSTLARRQSLRPEMIQKFKAYLRDARPKLIAVEYRKQKGCSVFYIGCPFRHFDYQRAKHLRYFKRLLSHRYRLVKTFADEFRGVKVFRRIKH